MEKKKKNREFPSISKCNPEGREGHAVAADLDGTLLVGRSSFPYFMLVAMEAGGLARGLLLLLSSPLILFFYTLISESAGIKIMIFVALSGIKIKDIEEKSKTVLPKFYSADVRSDSWTVFRVCGRRKVVVTANPRVMVEPFVKGWLGGDLVLGTELGVWRGRATGLVGERGVMVGERKREVLEREFEGEELPEVGMGDRDTDHDFMAICKEGYMVPPNKRAEKVPQENLLSPASLSNSSRFSLRLEPANAILMFLWLPFGFLLSLLRLVLSYTIPHSRLLHLYRIVGLTITVRGNPQTVSKPRLLLCNRCTDLDTIVVSCIANCAKDAKVEIIKDLPPPTNVKQFRGLPSTVRRRDVILFAEERLVSPVMPVLAEFGERVLPVAVTVRGGMFNGGSGFSGLVFFLMNPWPVYEVIFLDGLPEKWDDGQSVEEILARVRGVIEKELKSRPTAPESKKFS